MPKRKYFIEYDEPARLEISWDGGWFYLKKNFLILFDGHPLGTFEKRSELEKGQEFQLPDGSYLKVNVISDHFNILHNGKSIQYLNNAKRIPLAALAMSVFLFALGLSTYIFKAESWNIRFYEYPMFYSKMASPFYVNLVAGMSIGFAFVFIVIGLYARRNYLISDLGFDFLLVLFLVVFSLFLPYQLGESIDVSNILIPLIALFAFGKKLYDLKKQQVQ